MVPTAPNNADSEPLTLRSRNGVEREQMHTPTLIKKPSQLRSRALWILCMRSAFGGMRNTDTLIRVGDNYLLEATSASR